MSQPEEIREKSAKTDAVLTPRELRHPPNQVPDPDRSRTRPTGSGRPSGPNRPSDSGSGRSAESTRSGESARDADDAAEVSTAQEEA